MPTNEDGRQGVFQRLRETESRYRGLFDAIDRGFCIIDIEFDTTMQPVDYRFLEANAAFELQTGMNEVAGKSIRALAPEREQYGLDIYGEVARDGGQRRFERKMDDSGKRYEVLAFKIGDAEETKVGILFDDVSDQRETERALIESQRRLRSLIEGIPQLVWRSRGDGLWSWASLQWSDYTGLSSEESAGRGWLDAVHPDDRDSAVGAWAKAADAAHFEVRYRIRRADDGLYRWFVTRATPSRDGAGEIVEWLGTSTDVDDLHRARDKERSLLFELQHRVRNTLAVVRSIVRRTATNAQTLEDYTSNLEGRIDALARVQSGLAGDPTVGTDLAMMIADELGACAVREGPQLTLGGPPVRLNSRAAGSLALAIHELATNALKFGALSLEGGRVAVAWGHIDPTHLKLEWKESGLTGLSAPSSEGFGVRLFEKMLPYELQSMTDLVFEGDGVRCTMTLPLDRLCLPPAGN